MRSNIHSPESGPIVRNRTRSGEIGDVSLIPAKNLINRINFLHFQGHGIQCCFEHAQNGETVFLPLKPAPVLGRNLVLLRPDRPEINITDYRLKTVTIPINDTQVEIVPHILASTARGFSIRLPESIRATGEKSKKWPFPGDAFVKIHNDRISINGAIDDIRDNTVSVCLQNGRDYDFAAHGPEPLYSVSFLKGRRILFSGQFRLIDARQEQDGVKLRLTPTARVIHRQLPKKFRASRLSVLPTPDANAIHPLHDGYISMDIHDLSGSGFSILCESDEFGLITGMVFPEMELNFAGALTIPCSAQVVHQRTLKTEDGKNKRLFGFSFIDLSPDDHLKLMGILLQKKDSNVRLCQAVDENSLWSFFFESGSIYAKKYLALNKDAALIRETYRRLYTRPTSISRHFIYREKGEVIGHMSMLRMFHDAWLIHHHAARKHDAIKAGLTILNHMSWFCNNSLWLESSHIRYMICYFRPENAFPRFFFYEFAQRLNDKAGCSTDAFAYLTARKHRGALPALPEGWALEEAGPEDLGVLSRHYREHSGGLALDAMDLSPAFPGSVGLEKAYHDAGFKKERHLYALKNKGRTAAIALINITDLALNLANLTNCLTVFVVDEAGLSRDIWTGMVKILSGFFLHKQFSILLNPISYAENRDIAFKKQYIFWVLAARYSDHFFEHLTQVDKIVAPNHKKETS